GKIVTSNVIILLVPKGNPKNLTSLESLTKSGLKVGVADPQKSALGDLTQKMLDKHSLSGKVQPNIVVLAS
ncbi:MAG: substrate-binding domain-containing protein, partial [Akkermansiaceae bacterium]